MRTFRFKTIQKYIPLYLPVIAISVWMRYLCRIDDSDMLTWILTPTARWVSILSGISFEYIAHSGYVNHFQQFLIAPACSGIRFMLLTFLMLVFSFLKPDDVLMKESSAYKRYLWLGYSLFLSYFFTIFVNGIRISASIYLPAVFENNGLLNGWLTPDRLHTLIGSVIYFSSLYFIYPAAGFICRHILLRADKKNQNISSQCSDSFLSRSMIPVFWYLLIVLAVPFLGRLCRNEWAGFGGYAALVLCVCLSIVLLRYLIQAFHQHIS
ncbi:MAG: exosortase K [Bacillus sp. (in: Bacteria)]|nr:exosortase K [Bacillus sp. (in: firmicutes)]MCM1425566.1 exosortase K [Eubacterium sp.]